MIAEKDDNGFLILSFKVGDKLLKRFIGELHQGQVIIKGGGIRSLYLDIRMEIVKAFRIGRMILHGDIKQEKGLAFLFLLKAFYDFVKIRFVADIIPYQDGIFIIRKKMGFLESE